MSEHEGIKCDSCGKRKATVHLTEIVDGTPTKKHLCEECYGEQEDLPELSPSHVFTQLIEAVAPELKELSSKTCPECGTNYLEFRQTMKLGCPHDYEVFDKALEQLLERIHGAVEHVGKVPGSMTGARGWQDDAVSGRLEILQRKMEKAVEKEDYEKAAKLRDQIRHIKEHGPE